MSYPTLNFGLGETLDMLRDSVRQFSQAELEGARLHGSTLGGIQGAGGLRGVVVSSDQIVPLAHALLDAMGVTIDDD